MLVVLDAKADVVYYSTNQDIDQVTQGGTPTVFVAGTGANGINAPLVTTIDASGNLYVDNKNNGKIVEISPTGAISTFYDAQTTTGIYYGLAVDSSGDVYAAYRFGDEVVKITSDGAVTAVASGMYQPVAVAIDRNGIVYSYNLDDTITKIATDGTVSTFATGVGDGRAADLAVDASGNVYISNSSEILKITPGGTTTNFAAGVNSPYGLAFSPGGYLYVANGDGSILTVDPAGDVSTFASNTTAGYMGVRQTPEPTCLASVLILSFALGRRPRRRQAISFRAVGLFNF